MPLLLLHVEWMRQLQWGGMAGFYSSKREPRYPSAEAQQLGATGRTLVPLAAMSKEGDGALRAIDLGLAVALPVHSHIALNYVVSDYIPKPIRGPARYGVLMSTAVATLGLARLAMSEPGVTGTVKRLWSPAEADRRAAAMAKEARKELAVAAKKK